jgi:hypothetical protein
MKYWYNYKNEKTEGQVLFFLISDFWWRYWSFQYTCGMFDWKDNNTLTPTQLYPSSQW